MRHLVNMVIFGQKNENGRIYTQEEFMSDSNMEKIQSGKMFLSDGLIKTHLISLDNIIGVLKDMRLNKDGHTVDIVWDFLDTPKARALAPLMENLSSNFAVIPYGTEILDINGIVTDYKLHRFEVVFINNPS